MNPSVRFILCFFLYATVSPLWFYACAEEAVMTFRASGNAFAFDLSGDMIAGAKVTILEDPKKNTTTDEQGFFLFEGLHSSSQVTFVLEHPDYIPAQTATFIIENEDLTEVTFQVPKNNMYGLLTALIKITPEEDKCQIASTVTLPGLSLYNSFTHGVKGAVVQIEPSLPMENGPVYFNEMVLPDRTRQETSTDGGVLFVNVPENEYVLSAHKEGMVFDQVMIKCRAGMLVNASPPKGLQAH